MIGPAEAAFGRDDPFIEGYWKFADEWIFISVHVVFESDVLFLNFI